MKARIPLFGATLLAVLAASPVGAAAQDTFEGVVTFQVAMGQNGPQNVQYSVKAGKVRMDVSMGTMSMYTLFDPAAKTVDMVVPMRQMYIERSTTDVMAKADSAVGSAKITWTGNKETIAGYECEHATVTDDQGQSVDVCLAKGLGAFVPMSGGMGGRGGMGGGWESRIGQMFPLKVMHGDQVELLATSVEKKTLDASLFTIPDGYNKMDMPMGMPMRGRRGGGGGGA